MLIINIFSNRIVYFNWKHVFSKFNYFLNIYLDFNLWEITNYRLKFKISLPLIILSSIFTQGAHLIREWKKFSTSPACKDH